MGLFKGKTWKKIGNVAKIVATGGGSLGAFGTMAADAVSGMFSQGTGAMNFGAMPGLPGRGAAIHQVLNEQLDTSKKKRNSLGLGMGGAESAPTAMNVLAGI